MDNIKIDKPLVDVQWLKKHLKNRHLVVLDATLPKAVANNSQEVETKRIPGARFFDIKNVFSDVKATFPNTWPGEAIFNKAAQKLGIHKDSVIVVYDEHGIYSSARAWWMLKGMGHENVAVLNGGLMAWKKAGFELENKNVQTVEKGDFEGKFDRKYFKNHQDVLSFINDPSESVIDARASNRFKGLEEEPRKGLRSGHIPGSINLPYTDLLDDGKMLDEKELQSVFIRIAPTDGHITFSCGSGITACVLALGAEIAGYNNLSVYDGSWTEWGSIEELPIERDAKS